MPLTRYLWEKDFYFFLTFTDKKGVQSIRKINWANRFKVCKFCYISPWKNKNLRHAWDKVVVSNTFVLEKIQIVFFRKTILNLFFVSCLLHSRIKWGTIFCIIQRLGYHWITLSSNSCQDGHNIITSLRFISDDVSFYHFKHIKSFLPWTLSTSQSRTFITSIKVH